jgi:anti-sigma regulatory factor (Ser/Thr protein kinase)
MNTTIPVIQSFPAHPSALYHIRRFVRDQAAAAGMSDEATGELVLAVSEASANSVLHTGSPSVKVSFRDRGDLVEVTVQDQGVFQRRVLLPELDGSGHGIPLMTALVDEMTIREGSPARPGTLVMLVKAKASRQP